VSAVAIDDEVVAWSEHDSIAGKPLVILLHGYGQDELALAAISAELMHDAAVAALRGPRESRAPLAGGFGWYDVDERIRPIDGQEIETTLAVLEWLDAVIAQRGEPSRIAVVGFSQGAALALHLLRYAPERWDAVVTLAGYWLPGELTGEARLGELRPAVFWGRTADDPAIAPEDVATTAEALRGTVDLEEHVYPGAEHAIVPEELNDVLEFLRRRLGIAG